MTDTAAAPSKALTAPQRVKGLLDAKQDEFARALAGRVDPGAFVRAAYASITKSPKLLEATPASLMMALLECAALGLVPNSVMGEAYLVPFNNKVKQPDGSERWEVQVQFIPGYRGLAKLARNSGQVTQVIARAVREGDRFEVIQGAEERLEHAPALTGAKRPVVAFYCVARFREDPPMFDVMEKWEVDAIRQRSKSRDSGPWVTDYDEMGKKTVLRRLAKHLPLSDTDLLARALEADNRDFDMSAAVRQDGPVSDLNDALAGDEEFVGEVVPAEDAPPPVDERPSRQPDP
jgi:recombination protein RecT